MGQNLEEQDQVEPERKNDTLQGNLLKIGLEKIG
jgi:hypothetical protein